MKINAVRVLLILVLLVGLNACGNQYPEKGSDEYIQSINEYHNNRIKNLKTKSIWLKLCGLYWLDDGENNFGSAKGNNLIFPDGFESEMGKFVKTGNSVKLIVNDGIEIFVNNKVVNEINLIPDIDTNFTTMKYKNFSWFLIKRGEDRFGIRLMDENNSNLKNFEDIPTFPVNEDWKVTGKWIPYNPAITIETPSVIGTSSIDSCFGAIVFNKNEKEYKLHASGKGDELFIIFADGTSGAETYGAGRFVMAKVDYKNNTVEIDFNKAVNPPCSMSKYATCPLPPEGNRLKLRVTAGEMFEGHH